MQRTYLLLFWLLCCLCAPFAVQAQNDPATGTGEIAFTREFGTPGQTGSFRARFSKKGGGLVFLQMMDHFVTLEAARHKVHTKDDYLLLASLGNDHALRLWGQTAETRFASDLATADWTYTEIENGVQFSLASGNGLVLTKTLRHDPTQRGFVLEIELRNETADAGGNVTFQLLGPALVNPAESGLLGNASTAIAAPVTGDPKHVGPSAGKVQVLEVDPKTIAFAGNTNRFFASFLYPRDTAASAALTGFFVDTVPYVEDKDTLTQANSVTRVRYGMSLTVPAKGEATKVTYGLFLGPKAYSVFATLANPELFAPILDVDLSPPCCIDVPGGRMMAKLLLHLLGWFHGVVHNWGFAIIMLTVLVRGLLAPLNFRMQKSMRAYSARMAVLKPKLDALKERHADDPKAYQQAMIALQREHKLMPPIGGCLPIFLTMPVYLGLFSALRTAYDLRQQPFLLWITDLSRSDSLVDLGFWPHHFNLLPIVWIVLYLVMVLRQPLPTDPQARQMQTIMRYMPILIGVSLYGYASALMIYMVTSMVWTLFESAVTKRILGPMDPNVAAMTPTPM
ncbi:MAG: YidC/Oxa1 family insertase periplasmic-domain containing protein [Planctomycetes bacterium]|nr:YidC/Oxa1 family insertase periplasmic-domain containing protein [Planctomycetota bacterium]